jgi:hypothetical protein
MSRSSPIPIPPPSPSSTTTSNKDQEHVFDLSLGSNASEGSFLNSSREDLMLAKERHEATLNALHSRQVSLSHGSSGLYGNKSIVDDDDEGDDDEEVWICMFFHSLSFYLSFFLFLFLSS